MGAPNYTPCSFNFSFNHYQLQVQQSTTASEELEQKSTMSIGRVIRVQARNKEEKPRIDRDHAENPLRTPKKPSQERRSSSSDLSPHAWSHLIRLRFMTLSHQRNSSPSPKPQISKRKRGHMKVRKSKGSIEMQEIGAGGPWIMDRKRITGKVGIEIGTKREKK